MNEHFDVTYTSLFRRYYTNLIYYATSIVGLEDAEDVLEEVFIRILRHIEKFREEISM